MSGDGRNVRFTRLSGWGPEDATGIGGLMQDTDPAAGPRGISGGVLEGVPETVSDAQARETLRGALRLWTDAGKSPDEAFSALAQIARDGGQWRFDEVAHAAHAGAVQAATLRDGHRPAREIEQTRTLIESGLGASARLVWAVHDAREQGEGLGTRNERAARARYVAALDEEAARERTVQVPGETRPTWTDRRLIEAGATVVAMGEARLVRSVRTLLALGTGEADGGERVAQARWEAGAAGGAEPRRFAESAIEMVKQGRNDLGAAGSGQSRGRAMQAWLGEAQRAAESRGGRPLSEEEVEEAKALARRTIHALGRDIGVSPRGALYLREEDGEGESAARAAEREWAGGDPRILRAATRALGGTLAHLPQGHAEVDIREAALNEAAWSDERGAPERSPMVARIDAERSVRAAVRARLRLPLGKEVPEPLAEVRQCVHTVLEREGGDAGLRALARAAGEEVQGARDVPDIRTALAKALDGVWDPKHGSPARMRPADPERLEAAAEAVARTPAVRLGMRPERKDEIVRTLGEGVRAARAWAERAAREAAPAKDTRER